MRPVPTSLKNKLLERFKSEQLGNAPSVKVISTQRTTNTLLSEPIHTDIDPDFGDVAVRQMDGESEISLAYAICIDNGIAQIWRRNLPALMENKWEMIWEYGQAEDVAICYDGEWVMDPDEAWYYLKTEEFPYIFTVEDGDLYVQKWRDSTTRTLLAENVSNISAIKGWKDLVTENYDQGMIVAFLRDSKVYYKAFAYSSATGLCNWEEEVLVSELGASNDNLNLLLTNDFRIGFIAEQSGNIKLALTKRTYPGMSVKSETIFTNEEAYFSYNAAVRKYGKTQEHLTTDADAFFLFCSNQESPNIQIVDCSRKIHLENLINVCTGVRITFSHPLLGDISDSFVSGCSSSSNKVNISDVNFGENRKILELDFSWVAGQTKNVLPDAFTITLPQDMSLTYELFGNQTWYFASIIASFEAINNQIYAYHNENISVRETTELSYSAVEKESGLLNESIIASLTVDLNYLPVRDIPI